MRTYVPIFKQSGWDDITKSMVDVEFGVFVRSTWDFRDSGTPSRGRNMMSLFLTQDGRMVEMVGLDTGQWTAPEGT